jgi:hypothetical protein
MYISSAHQTALRARYRLTALIVVALGVSTLLYVVIGWAFAPAMPRGDYEWLTYGHYILLGLMGVASVAVVFLRWFFLSPSRLQNARQKGVGALLSQLYLNSLVGAVIGDVVGILGVVGSLVTGNREYSWRFGIVALFLLAYSFPRRGEWTRAVAALEAEKNDVPKAAPTATEQIRLGLSETE